MHCDAAFALHRMSVQAKMIVAHHLDAQFSLAVDHRPYGALWRTPGPSDNAFCSDGDLQ
jgi:hypothetical protein